MIIQFDEKYKSFPKEEYDLHVEKLQTEMKKMNLDLLLLTSPENIYYSTGYRSWYTSSLFRPVYVLVPLEGDPAVILRILEKSTVKFTSWTPNVFVSGTKARNIGYLDAESHIEVPTMNMRGSSSWVRGSKNTSTTNATYTTVVEHIRMTSSS